MEEKHIAFLGVILLLWLIKLPEYLFGIKNVESTILFIFLPLVGGAVVYIVTDMIFRKNKIKEE